MRVLVTGGAGFIGSQVCKALKFAGHTPIVYDSLENGFEWTVKWGPFVKANLSDQPSITSALKEHNVDAVMHFAALTNVRESFDRPALYYEYNVRNTINLLSAMDACYVDKLIFSSSCAIYGVPKVFPISEKTPANPVNPYGKTKLICEEIMADFPKLKYVALRYFNAAGADIDGDLGESHSPPSHLIPIVIDCILHDKPFELYGRDHDTLDGTSVRDYIHVFDLASAHVKSLSYLEAGGKPIALNLGTGKPYSVQQVINEVETQSGKKLHVIDKPSHKGEPDHLECDYHLAESTLNWKPCHSSLSEMVKDTLRWQKTL